MRADVLEREVVVHRYYDATTGQFLSVDPLVDQTGQPYGYAGDNPINAADPLGLCSGPDGTCVDQNTGAANLNSSDVPSDYSGDSGQSSTYQLANWTQPTGSAAAAPTETTSGSATQPSLLSSQATVVPPSSSDRTVQNIETISGWVQTGCDEATLLTLGASAEGTVPCAGAAGIVNGASTCTLAVKEGRHSEVQDCAAALVATPIADIVNASTVHNVETETDLAVAGFGRVIDWIRSW